MIQNALFLGRKKASALTMPWCTYTDPEIAHVGLYERDARERGMDVDTYVREFKDVDRAVLDGEEDGFVKSTSGKARDEILGATIVARHAGEMISEISVAMAARHGLGQTGLRHSSLSDAGRSDPSMRRCLQSDPINPDGEEMDGALAGWQARILDL